MAKRSNETVSEIVENVETIPDEPEEELAEAEPKPDEFDEEYSPRASDYFVGDIANVKSVSAAREAAHIPPHFPMKDLEGKTVIFVHKRKQKAALPGTGELREGYFCLCKFADSGEDFTTWVGQTILYRELTLLEMPFSTTIVKRGRTYMFQ